MATGTPLPTLPMIVTDPSDHERRQRLTRHARRLTQLGLGWHVVEAAIAVAAGIVAASFIVLALYVTVEAARDLIAGHHPAVSWVGVALAAVTLSAMPPLAAAKRRVGIALNSAATTSESRQTMLCAYLSAALLIGLLANALAGWWWADPAVALLIGAAAITEARDAWRGESCSCC